LLKTEMKADDNIHEDNGKDQNSFMMDNVKYKTIILCTLI
jgi:hypothetical protein